MRNFYQNYSKSFRYFKQHWKRILFRAHKDRRSLSAILLAVGMIAYVCYYGFFFFTKPFSFVLLLLGSFFAWRIRSSHQKDDEAFLKLSNHEPPEIKPSVAIIKELGDKTLRLWLLLWRASSEKHLKRYEIPAGREVVTRRIILDKLTALDLKIQLAPEELNLHLLPDGAWTIEDIGSQALRIPELQALQYVCGIHEVIFLIEDLNVFSDVDVTFIEKLETQPTFYLQNISDIRLERDISATFYLRCLKEQVQRGLATYRPDDETQEVLNSISNTGKQSSDHLLGTKIVSEVTDEELIFSSQQIYTRYKALKNALSMLEDSQPTSA